MSPPEKPAPISCPTCKTALDCHRPREAGQGCDACAACLKFLTKGAAEMAADWRASCDRWEKIALQYLAERDALQAKLAALEGARP